MGDTKKRTETPLLMYDLSQAERIVLGQTTHTAGFKVLIKLFDAAVTAAGNDRLTLDPEQEGYERKLSVRAQRERNFAECIDLVNKAVVFHSDSVVAEAQTADALAEDAVAKVFKPYGGIYRVKTKEQKAKEAQEQKVANESVI